MRQRFVTFLVFGVLLIGIGEWDLRSHKIGTLSKLNDFWLEFCAGNAGDRLKNPAISLIRIDDGYEPLRVGVDETVPDDGKLSRLDFATILGFVAKLNPRSVVFLPTPAFDETLVLNQTDVVPLKDAAMQLPKLTVASTISNDGEQAKEAKPLNYPSLKLAGDAASLLTFTRTVTYPDAQILENGIPAFKSIESARDLISDKAIRIPLVAKRGDQIIPSVILAAVANHAGVALDQITVDLEGKNLVIRIGETYSVPIAPDGTLLLPPYSGISQSMKSLNADDSGEMKETYHFTTLTVDELAYTGGKEDEVAKRILANFQSKFESLKDNLVVIGFDRTADRRLNTAKGVVLSETTALARAMAVIQSGRYIHWWPSWARWASILAVVVLASILFKLPRRKFLPLSFVAALIFFTAHVMIFSATLSWTPPFVTLSLFGLMMLLGILIPNRDIPKEAPKTEA